MWLSAIRDIALEKKIELKGYVICNEPHKETKQWHVHAWLEFEPEFTSKSAACLDVLGYHPNIKSLAKAHRGLGKLLSQRRKLH